MRQGPVLFKKSLSWALTLLLGAQSAAWAAPASAPPASSSVSQVRFELPPAVALVDDRHTASGDKLVVLIQDAHTNESGQMNLARALERILPAQNIRTVYTEGASAGADVTPDVLKTGTAADRERIGQAYLRKGLLSGAEYFSMTYEQDFRIAGTERMDLYLEAGELYQAAAGSRAVSLRWLDRLWRALQALKEDLWTPELRKLDTLRSSYLEGSVPLTGYFEALTEAGRANGVPAERHPNLGFLIDLKRLEDRIDFKRAGEEEAAAMKALPADRREALAGLRKVHSPFKRSAAAERGTEGFFTALESELAVAGRTRADHPELFTYFEYLRETQKLRASDTLNELERYEAEVWRAMSPSRHAAELELILQSVARMRRVAELKATPQDLDAFRRQPAPHDPRFAAAWTNRRIADLGRHHGLAVTLDTGFEAAFDTAKLFYDAHAGRDAVIADRILAQMEASGEGAAVLIAGGFHAPNLKRIFRSRGVSYVSVLPQVTHETDAARYERLVVSALGEVAPAASSGWILPPVVTRTSTLERIVEDLNADRDPPASGARLTRAVRTEPAPDSLFKPRDPSTAELPYEPKQREHVIPLTPPGGKGPGGNDPPLGLIPSSAATATPAPTGVRSSRAEAVPSDRSVVPEIDARPEVPAVSPPAATSSASAAARMSVPAAFSGSDFNLPVIAAQHPFVGIDRQYGLSFKGIRALPLNPAADLRAEGGQLDLSDPDGTMAYGAVMTTVYEAIAANGFTGLGVRDDVKEAADSVAVAMGEKAFLAMTKENPNIAIVIFADEGGKDGSVSQPLRTVYYRGTRKTESTNRHMMSRIDALQKRGVKVYAGLGDAIDNTRGLVNPDALELPGDSVSITGLVLLPPVKEFSGKNPFLVADEALRVGGVTLHVPDASEDTIRRIESKLTPYSGPEEIVRVLQEELGQTFDPNQLSFVVLGTGSKQKRHQHLIDQALKLNGKANGADDAQAPYPGLQIIPVPDGDPFPRILAGIGGRLHKERFWVVIGRGGSTENILVMHALRTLASTTYVHTLVSPKGTDGDFSSTNSDARVRAGRNNTGAEAARQEEWDIVNQLDTPDYYLNSEKLTPSDYRPGILAVSSITGATGRFGSMKDLFRRVTYSRTVGERTGKVSVRTIFTLLDGSAFAAEVDFDIEDFYKTRQSLMRAHSVAQTHLNSLQDGIEVLFDRILTQASSQIRGGGRSVIKQLREAHTKYQAGDFLEAADEVETLMQSVEAAEPLSDSTFRSEWIGLAAMLRGRPAEGARLAELRPAGNLAAAAAEPSAPRILSGRPVQKRWISQRQLQQLSPFAARTILSGSASEGSQLPLQTLRTGFVVLQTSEVTSSSVQVAVIGGPSTALDLEDERQTEIRTRVSLTPTAESLGPEARSAAKIRASDLRDAVRAVAGKGVVDAYLRVPVGDLFPEILAGKPNLTSEQVRDEIVILLSDLAAFSEDPEIGSRIQIYLDMENLSSANRLWLERLIGTGRKSQRFTQFHILSEKDPLPFKKLVFNWYVDEAHKDWVTEAGAARRTITGSHLRLAPTRPGLVQRWGLAVRIPIEAVYAALPDASTTASDEIGDRFVQAPTFNDQGEFWERSMRGGWFQRGAGFVSAGDLLKRVQGAELFLDHQVASYLFIKDVSEWVDFVRKMRQKTATSV